MKNIRKYMMMAAVACMTLCGCDDFLEPSSPDEFVPKDATSLNEILLGEAYPRYDVGRLNIFLNLLEDDIQATPYQNPMDGSESMLNTYLAAYAWQPEMYSIMEENSVYNTNMYATYYSLILGCNAVLDYIGEVVDEADNINYVKAQAYALRGFFYFNLVNIFGWPYNDDPEAMGVPLKLNSEMETEEKALARRTVGECYTQILADLHEAEALYESLPESMQWKANYRTSLPMVQLMLSRTYLYMENWKEAAAYAEKVMKNTNFKLADLRSLSDIVEDDYGTEYRYYPVLHSYSTFNEAIWLYGNNDDMFDYAYNYAGKSHNSTNVQMYSYFCASDGLLNSYEENDLRQRYYIVRKEAKALRDEDGNVLLMPMPYGKSLVGMYNYAPQNTTGTFGRSLRLSEAYLNYSEAMAMQYKNGGIGLTEALGALNDLRTMRFTVENYTEVNISDAEELLDFIKEERRRELCFEGHRWYDLRRWGMPEITHQWYPEPGKVATYTLNKGDEAYAVPIPNEALDLNASLEQNKYTVSERSGVITDLPVDDEGSEGEGEGGEE